MVVKQKSTDGGLILVLVIRY